MRKPLAQQPLKNRPSLLPVGLDAILLRPFILFCEFKKFICSSIEFFFWTYVSRLCHAWIHLMCKLCIPICISCCFTIMMQSPIEGANTEKGQEVLKHFSSSLDRYNGVSNLLPNFLWLNIGNNFRENAFKLGIDSIFEFFRGSEIISTSVNNEATQNREHNTN
jgi:hypothetical protein